MPSRVGPQMSRTWLALGVLDAPRRPLPLRSSADPHGAPRRRTLAGRVVPRTPARHGALRTPLDHLSCARLSSGLAASGTAGPAQPNPPRLIGGATGAAPPPLECGIFGGLESKLPDSTRAALHLTCSAHNVACWSSSSSEPRARAAAAARRAARMRAQSNPRKNHDEMSK